VKPYRENHLQPAAQYLKETESAVKNLFKNLKEYDAIRKKIMFPICNAPYALVEESRVAFKKWQRENRVAWKEASEMLHKYFGYQFSINTLNGSILQIAYMGIKLYSKNEVVPPEFPSIIRPVSNIAHFCVGRRVREVPIGLIIYAARNQYNHWDEEHLRNRVNEWVFNMLATKHGIKDAQGIKEPAFDLSNKMIQIYSSNVVFILGWCSYDAYLVDMKNLLISSEKR
jgi:hypothetical protein